MAARISRKENQSIRQSLIARQCTTDKQLQDTTNTKRARQQGSRALAAALNSLMGTGNYSTTSNNIKLIHWPLMGGPIHLVQRGGDWAGPQPAQAPPRCTKCIGPPISGQCTNQRIAVMVRCCAV